MSYQYNRTKTAGTLFEQKQFEAALNAVHAILDSIADEMGSHKEHGAPHGRETANLEGARTDLQKAAALILSAQKRF